MINILRSEFIKFKNTSVFKIIILNGIFNIIIFLAIFNSGTKLSIESRQDIFISLYFILNLLLITYLINFSYAEEKKTNKFQRIITDGKYFYSWISKYLIILTTVLITNILFIYIIKFISANFIDLSRYVLALIIHIVSVSILQIIFVVLFQEITSIVLSFLGMIILIFSTNIPMDKIWLMVPYIYGYKVYEKYNYIYIYEYSYILATIFFMFIFFMILIRIYKNKFFESSHKK